MAAHPTDTVIPWRVLRQSLKAKVSLAMTLCGGQCFHWYPTSRGTFVGRIGHGVFELREVRCPAKLEKMKGLQREESESPVSPPGKSKREAASSSASWESVVRGLPWYSCCWIEYRRLWPLGDQPTPTGKKRTSPLFSSLRTSASPASTAEESDEDMLCRFLSLDVDLDQLWRSWTDSPQTREHPLVAYLVGNGLQQRSLPTSQDQRDCEHDEAGSKLYIPIRHVRQDLHSCLFSFLCSQNNNVTRITSMVYTLCRAYGDHLCDVQLGSGEVRAVRKSGPETRPKKTEHGAPSSASVDEEGAVVSLPLKLSDCRTEASEWLAMHSFPSLEQLSTATEEKLRQLGFGYRSKYLVDTVTFLRTQLPPRELQDPDALTGQTCLPPHLLWQHRGCYQNAFYSVVLGHHSCHYHHQRDMLLLLPGVGRKVADCVALFALGRTHLVPVDTHMAQVAVEYLVSPKFTAASRKRSRAGRSLSEEERHSWEDVLVEWGKQAEVLKRKKRGASPESVHAVKAGARAAPVTLRSSKTTPVPPLYQQHHNAIQDAFWMTFGDYAGWAHSILFYYRMRK
ncbi:hypothetical protein JKF63_01783 [Porcisia hertigi]|uniref:DNA-(apurinic or apyrimidinic site) lyase n=1 Tax=Porcisia hertigi TaxID=2761500 RepID=A0A836HIR5_9TRYP|nr:hypothetical protein JKF63_01783 [Porcisia hertigi]